MKIKLFILGLTMFCANHVVAHENVPSNKPAIENLTSLSLGALSPAGLIGVQHEYSLTANDSFVASAGFDMAGFLLGVGYRRYTDLIVNSANTIWDKCFFVFDCKRRFGLGADVIHASSGEYMISSSSGNRTYSFSSHQLIDVVLVDQNYFENGIVTGFGFSYRTPLNKKRIELLSGDAVSGDESNIRSSSQGLGVQLTIGYSY